jgi:predicted 3-demethylubiquinone-9 3-methyltransferase (glyoxalase superfamily)
MTTAQKIKPCLWFASQALEAAEFYTALFPNSRIGAVHHARADTPGGREGDVLLVSFTLAGRDYLALNGGPHDAFNDAVSLSVDCNDQAEVDRLWAALTADGGRPVACGWLKDKYGFAWQIVPRRLPELLSDPDPAVGKRVMHAMMQMVKLDIAGLEAAAHG